MYSGRDSFHQGGGDDVDAVLIVDDEPVVRRLLEELLVGDGFRVVTAEDLADARGILERAETTFDVALIDKNLPDGSGLDLARDLKRAHPNTEIILMTGYASLESAIAAIEVGAFDYLVKPFPELQGLLLKVRNAAEQARLHRLEAQIIHAQKLEALGTLAGGVAHDFNNLLAIVSSCATEALRTITAGRVDGETTSALNDILDATRCATDLTRQLLAFSRQTAGPAEPVDVNDVIDQMLTLLRRVVGKRIRIHVECDRTAGAIRIPRSHLEQILVNLLVNARDAIDLRGEITIRTAMRGDSVELSVTDSGSGMPPEVVARIFEPFYTTKGVGRGTGMGLSVVARVVKQAHGRIDVESTVGRGTTFRITFPVATAVEILDVRASAGRS
jgi:signal transduction histidine kinase